MSASIAALSCSVRTMVCPEGEATVGPDLTKVVVGERDGAGVPGTTPNIV